MSSDTTAFYFPYSKWKYNNFNSYNRSHQFKSNGASFTKLQITKIVLVLHLVNRLSYSIYWYDINYVKKVLYIYFNAKYDFVDVEFWQLNCSILVSPQLHFHMSYTLRSQLLFLQFLLRIFRWQWKQDWLNGLKHIVLDQ